MCITSCKNSPFLKPPSSLNPGAREWRPPKLKPNPPPRLTAAHVVVLAAHLPHKSLWHPSPQPQCYHPMPYLPRAWPHFIYHSPPSSFPATGRLHAAAPPPPPPLFGADGKDAGQLEEKKLERPIVNGGSKLVVSKTSKPPPPTAPPRRWEWKPRKTVACGGAASDASPLTEEISSRTTVMVKNIPNQLRRDSMVEFVDNYCNAHSLEYDFMYLPMDFRSRDNLGYAFVNFTNGGDAVKFKKILNGYKWGTIQTEKGFYTSKKICAITWAKIQGKEKLVKRFENTTFCCDDPGFLPVVFDPPRGSNTTSPVIVGRLNDQVRG